MTSIVLRTPLKSYKCLMFLAMIYFLISIAILLFNKKMVVIPILHFTTFSILISGIQFILADIVTEIYGYHTAQKVILSNYIALGLFALLAACALRTPTPDNFTVAWASAQNPTAYAYVFGTMLRDFFDTTLGFLVGAYFNIYLLSKWKTLLRGRYFWLRSIGSSLVGIIISGVIINSLIGFHAITTNAMSFLVLAKLILASIVLKLLTLIVFAYPATFFCAMLKMIEGADVYDNHVNYNPFKAFSDDASIKK